MNSALKALTAAAISFISTALVFKQFNLSGWENSAAIGGSLLFFVFAAIIGLVFKQDIIPSLIISSIITGFIMLFIWTVFGLFLIFFGLIGLILLRLK